MIRKWAIIPTIAILYFVSQCLPALSDTVDKGIEENGYRRDIEEERKIKTETEETLIKRYYKYGEQLYKQGDFEEALIQFKKVLKLKPSYRKTDYYITKCEEGLKKQEIQKVKKGTEILLEKLKKEEIPYVGEKIEIDSPVDLKKCIDIALDNNTEIKKNLKEIEGLKAKYQQSIFLFTPEVKAGFENYSEPDIEDVTSTRNRLRLLLNQPLYDASKQHKILEIKEKLAAANDRYIPAKSKIIYSVIKNYFTYQKAKRTKESFEKMLEIAKKKFNIVNALYKGGLALKVDLLKSEETALAAEENLSFAQNNLSYTRISLNQAMGLVPSFLLEIKGDETIKTSRITLNELPYLNYKAHPRYKQLEEKIKITEYDIKLEPSELHPKVDIGVDHVLFGDSFPVHKGFTELMFTVKVPIFAYLNQMGKGSQGEDLIDALELEKIQLQKELSSEAEAIFLDYLDAKRRFAITSKRLKWAEEQFQSLRSLYKFGDESKLTTGMGKEESKALTALDAQLVLLSTEMENFQAEYDVYINSVKLREALGQNPQDWLDESMEVQKSNS